MGYRHKGGGAETIRVLVIDDNEGITSALRFYFEETGIDYEISNDGKEGLELIRNEIFDLILLDIDMPHFTGLDIIKSLKQDGLIERRNIIVITASSDKSVLEIIEQNEGMRILKKPFALDDLKELMDKYYN
jgi:CheY-like chemotaxis protein